MLASLPDEPEEMAATAPAGEDGELLIRLRRRDGRAYEELVRRHLPRLLPLARRFVGEEEARDVVQETFLSAFKAIDSFDGQARLSTWLHRIAVNACLMRLRRRSAQVEQSLEPLLPAFLEDGHRQGVGPAWPETPEEVFGRAETCRRVRAAVAALPESYRRVILLRDFEELDGQETAELLGITTNSMKVRLHRARQALRELLDRRFREAL